MSDLAAIYLKSNLQTAVDAAKNRLRAVPSSQTGYLYAGIGFSIETQGENINDVSVFTFLYGNGLNVADARQSIAVIPDSYETFENNAWQTLTGSKDKHRFAFWDYAGNSGNNPNDVYFGIDAVEYILHYFDAVMLSGAEATAGNGAFDYDKMPLLKLEGRNANREKSAHVLRATLGQPCPPLCADKS